MELRHKRAYGCRKKWLNTKTFFNSHYMTLKKGGNPP
jgi:hypothetical protein